MSLPGHATGAAQNSMEPAMPVIGICVAILPVLAVLAVTAVVKAVLLPFSAVRLLYRSHAARA
ncbi:hypothetical protein GCM10007885_39170 [Methylobacterium gnaphalii]|nr:hypothetical protein GCM10007885_39170 [Methylobacterium gnaphalii]